MCTYWGKAAFNRMRDHKGILINTQEGFRWVFWIKKKVLLFVSRPSAPRPTTCFFSNLKPTAVLSASVRQQRYRHGKNLRCVLGAFDPPLSSSQPRSVSLAADPELHASEVPPHQKIVLRQGVCILSPLGAPVKKKCSLCFSHSCGQDNKTQELPLLARA